MPPREQPAYIRCPPALLGRSYLHARRLLGSTRALPKTRRTDRQFPALKKTSLIRQQEFPVPCRAGNRPQRTGIAAQIDARTRRKAPKWPEISKIPCYFPCHQGIGISGWRGVGVFAGAAKAPLLPEDKNMHRFEDVITRSLSIS